MPELTLLVLVKVRVPRPALVTPSLLAAFPALLSVSITPMEPSVTEVTSVAEVPSARMVAVEAAELVMKPEPLTVRVVRSRLKPLRSRAAPALMESALAAGMTPEAPRRSRPAVTVVAPA